MRILLVEDDSSLGDTLCDWLALDGAVVDWVKSAPSAIHALQEYEYTCVLLDRGLPKMAGDEVLKFVRQKNLPVAVLMITAQDSIADRVAGLDLGADDYLVKPFDLNELSARIRASIRKYTPTSTPVLSFANLSLDPAKKQAFLDNTPLTLSQKEYAILHRLMRTPTSIVSKEQLEDELYGWGDEVESNAVEVYVSHLRKKIGAGRIKTLRKQGYLLNDE